MHITDNSAKMEKTMLQRTQIYYPDGKVERGESEIITEHSLRIFVNEKLAFRLICTPDNLKELVVGRLITEGVIHKMEDVEQLYICDSGHTARVYLTSEDSLRQQSDDCHKHIKTAELAGYMNNNLSEQSRSIEKTTEEPTCCTDNISYLQRTDIGQLTTKLPKAVWQTEWVFYMAKIFKEDSQMHKTTWGTHSCYLGVAGEVVFSAEDIGRHNALDKAVGHAALSGIRPMDCMLFTTGRVPVDMVRKAIFAGIPLLISKAVPTLEAVKLAREYGLTLICKAWPDKFEVFA